MPADVRIPGKEDKKIYLCKLTDGAQYHTWLHAMACTLQYQIILQTICMILMIHQQNTAAQSNSSPASTPVAYSMYLVEASSEILTSLFQLDIKAFTNASGIHADIWLAQS